MIGDFLSPGFFLGLGFLGDGNFFVATSAGDSIVFLYKNNFDLLDI